MQNHFLILTTPGVRIRVRNNRRNDNGRRPSHKPDFSIIHWEDDNFVQVSWPTLSMIRNKIDTIFDTLWNWNIYYMNNSFLEMITNDDTAPSHQDMNSIKLSILMQKLHKWWHFSSSASPLFPFCRCHNRILSLRLIFAENQNTLIIWKMRFHGIIAKSFN